MTERDSRLADRRALPSPSHVGKHIEENGGITPLLSVPDVARILKCSRASVYKMATTGEIPSIIVAGKLVRVHPDDVRDYISRQREKRAAR